MLIGPDNLQFNRPISLSWLNWFKRILESASAVLIWTTLSVDGEYGRTVAVSHPLKITPMLSAPNAKKFSLLLLLLINDRMSRLLNKQKNYWLHQLCQIWFYGSYFEQKIHPARVKVSNQFNELGRPRHYPSNRTLLMYCPTYFWFRVDSNQILHWNSKTIVVHFRNVQLSGMVFWGIR